MDNAPPGAICQSLPIRRGYMVQVRTREGWVDALQGMVDDYTDVVHFDRNNSLRLIRRTIEDVVLL